MLIDRTLVLCTDHELNASTFAARVAASTRGSAAALFAIGRIPGWVAHTLEQRAQRYILRPRARYVPASAAG